MNNESKEDLKPVAYLTPFKRFCMTIGELPSSYIETMTYYEMLVWFTEYMKNTVIPTINNNGEAVNELQDKFVEFANTLSQEQTDFENSITEQQNTFETNITTQQNNYETHITELFNQLQTFVNNYFDNLDVQDEINNKLDDMVEQGVFDEIINQTLFGELNEKVDNQKYFVTPEEFGAVGDGTTDDTSAINQAIQSLTRGGIVYFRPKTYLIKGSILIDKHSITLMGTQSNIQNNGTILKATDDSTDPMIVVNKNGQIVGGSIKNLALYGSDERYTQTNSVKRIGLYIENVAEFMLDNVNINGFSKEGLKADKWWDSTVYNLQVTACGNLSDNLYGVYLTASSDSTNSIKFTSCHFENNVKHLKIDNLASHIHFTECKFENSSLAGSSTDVIKIAQGVFTIIFNSCFFTQLRDSQQTPNFVFDIENNYTIISNCIFQTGVNEAGKWIRHHGTGSNTGNGILIIGNSFRGCCPEKSIELNQNALFTGNIVSLASDPNQTIYVTYNAKIDNNIFLCNGNQNVVCYFNSPSNFRSSFKNNQITGATSTFVNNNRQVDRDIKLHTIINLDTNIINVDVPYADYFINTSGLSISDINGGQLGNKFRVFCNRQTTFTCASNKTNFTVNAGGCVEFEYIDNTLGWWVTNIYNIA